MVVIYKPSLKSKALLRSKHLAALALSRRICARAQNVLSAAQFCAHFKIPKRFQSTIFRQQTQQTSSMGHYFLHFSENIFKTKNMLKKSLDFCDLEGHFF